MEHENARIDSPCFQKGVFDLCDCTMSLICVSALFAFYDSQSIPRLSSFCLVFCFIASFAFVLQRCKRRRLRAKPIPLRLRAPKGSPFGRAPAIAGERVVVATICPLRRLRRHLSQRERLLASSIITQIGRGNNPFADFFVLAYSPLRITE